MTTPTPEATTKRSFLLSGEGWPYLLAPLIPVAIVLSSSMQTRADLCRFRARRHPDCRPHGARHRGACVGSGPGIGGFLNVTFGNAPELIIALFALAAGLHGS